MHRVVHAGHGGALSGSSFVYRFLIPLIANQYVGERVVDRRVFSCEWFVHEDVLNMV